PGATSRRPHLTVPDSATNIGSGLTAFIGRTRELAQLSRILAVSRLVTLTGSGGCGKTRLALELTLRVRDRFPDGVWEADLAPLRRAGLLPQAVAAALG